MADFLTDVQTLRDRARAEIERGPITQAYGADRAPVIVGLRRSATSPKLC